MKQSLKERFDSKIEMLPECGCWIWMEKIGNTGYGHTWKDGKCKSAHRASYELFIGPVPSRWKHL